MEERRQEGIIINTMYMTQTIEKCLIKADIGWKGGPGVYKDVEQAQKIVDAYRDLCYEKKIDEQDKDIYTQDFGFIMWLNVWCIHQYSK